MSEPTPIRKHLWDMTPEEAAAHDSRVHAQQAAETEATEWRIAKALADRRAATMVPADFLDLITAGPMHDTQALAEVRRGEFRALVLAGAIGRGKSVAASWWLLDGPWPAKHDPLFVSSARLARWERYDNAAMDRLLLASKLVIDDLGEEFNDTKGNFLAVLDETVSDRISNRRPTVITTNLDVAKFRERYGERITDRIKGAGRWVAFTGDSFRGKQMGLLPAIGVHQ